MRSELDRYRTQLTNQAVIREVGACENARIIDAGCGEGYLSRLLAEQGAEVTGIDSCLELIEAARGISEPRVQYLHGSVESVPDDDSSYDVVVCNHLVNDLEFPDRSFNEFSRILRVGGRIIILMLHPCFYGPRAESVAPKRGELDVTQYFSTRPMSHPFRVAGISSPSEVKIWLRPLESYMKMLFAAGFRLTGLSEPHPPRELLESDDWWGDNFRRPLFLLIAGEKI
ncbi:class I SAM-dependent methyltransferase [Nocardia jiangsuensis]|uniref:Class I SAM-dependent methyltransferase n=1 Tax=Nocardia jiangsuensis TaxID=1691563 RepID=A0ABV8DL40_9NOCA